MDRDLTEEEENEIFTFQRAVGKRVKIMREKRGITRRQMTELANIKPAYGYLIEGEGQNFTLKTLIALANALHCLPRDLMPDPPIGTDLENENRLLKEHLLKLTEILDQVTPLLKPLRQSLDSMKPPKSYLPEPGSPDLNPD